MILVTGGTGLVGAHLLYELTSKGKSVRVLKREESNTANVKKVFSYYTSVPEKLLELIEWKDADLMDVYSLTEAMEGVTEVYHCAAMVSFNPKDEKEMMDINVQGTANMVNAALEKKINKFCHVSSIASIGKPENAVLYDETMFWKNSPDNSKYAISKYGAEREVWRAAEEGLNVCIVNPSLIVGPGNWTQSSSNMFTKAYKGIKFYTDGVNGFVDVRDVATAMVLLMDKNVFAERFLITAENKSYKYFFDLIHEQFGKPKPSIKAGKFLTGFAWRMEKLRFWIAGSNPLITKETARSAHKKSNYSNAKILKQFPDYKFISLQQSVKDTCEKFLMELK
jgi:nucleoside-diphosphate-sugar epimerase